MNVLFKLFGVLFLVLGITVVFNSFQGITGFAVYEDVDLNKGILVGVWFVLVGILLAVYRKKDSLQNKDKRRKK